MIQLHKLRDKPVAKGISCITGLKPRYGAKCYTTNQVAKGISCITGLKLNMTKITIDKSEPPVAKGISCITGLKHAMGCRTRLSGDYGCKRHFLYNGIETIEWNPANSHADAVAKGISCITGLKQFQRVGTVLRQRSCKRHFLYNGIETQYWSVQW